MPQRRGARKQRGRWLLAIVFWAICDMQCGIGSRTLAVHGTVRPPIHPLPPSLPANSSRGLWRRRFFEVTPASAGRGSGVFRAFKRGSASGGEGRGTGAWPVLGGGVPLQHQGLTRFGVFLLHFWALCGLGGFATRYSSAHACMWCVQMCRCHRVGRGRAPWWLIVPPSRLGVLADSRVCCCRWILLMRRRCRPNEL